MLIRLAVVTVLSGVLFQAKPDLFPPRDFLEYYSAAKVFAGGGDPYDGAQLLPVQREIVGNPDLEKPVSLWTPPYTLALYLPFALLPYNTAHFVWLLIQTLCLATSVELICRSYGWHRSLWLAQLIGFAFSPFFWNLHFGQNTGFILLGLAGFVRFRPSRPVLAGGFAALTAIKPHLLAVFGVLLLWDAWNRAGRRTLLGGLVVLLIGSLVIWAVQPHIFQWFVEALRRPTTPDAVRLADWDVPLLSYEFRRAVDPDRFGLQFLPLGITGIAAVVWNWKRPIHWPSALPWIGLLSCLVTPYGGGIFDLTVLVLPVLAVLSAARDPRLALLALALISWFGFRIVGLAEPIWFTPAVAVVLGYQWFQPRSQTS